MLTASSLPASPAPNTTSILLFPSFLSLPSLPNTPATYDALASAYLKAETLHPYHASLPAPQKAALTRDPSAAAALVFVDTCGDALFVRAGCIALAYRQRWR